MMTLFGPEQMASNRLQSHKSSFQAWKCVSFGCSLLAIVMLLSKWQEVTTDLHMLLGIDKLLAAQAEAAAGSPSGASVANSSSSNSQESPQNSQPLSWPPVPLEQLLPTANESNFGMESMATNESMLMSHLHMSLSRELSGNQLLRQEVDAFIGEFRNAKSTLSLSSLLVSVYIVSWILMTLAINDTRISNDISLRNILLLSVFGAIDVAASAGFVMVRLIMYSVKNNSFASELLSSAGLKDTPVRLSADQLTAFTALRLIAMRRISSINLNPAVVWIVNSGAHAQSCSAYVDVFVSVIVGLLTILRVHAILRALAYYRRLRRVTDFDNHPQHPHRSSQLMIGHDPAQPIERKQIWSTATSPFYTATTTANLISPGSAPLGTRLTSPAHHQHQHQHQAHPQQQQANELSAPANYPPAHASFRHLAPVMDPSGGGEQQQQQQRPQQQAVYAVVNRQHQNTLPLPRSSRESVGGLAAGSASLTRASQQYLFDSNHHQLQLMRPTAANSTSKPNNNDALLAASSPGARSDKLLVRLKTELGGGRQPSGSRHFQQQQQQRTTNNSLRDNALIGDRHNASSLLLLPGESSSCGNPFRLAGGLTKRHHHLTSATRHSTSSLQYSRRPPLRRHQLLQRLKRQPGKALLVSADSGRLLDCEPEYESEPHTFRVRLAEQVAARRTTTVPRRADNNEDEAGEAPELTGAETREAKLSKQNLTGAEPIASQSSSSSPPAAGSKLICDSNGNTYTLLSANQLEKLSRKLGASKQQQVAQFVQTGSSSGVLVAENPTYATANAGFAPKKRRLVEQHSVEQSSDVNNSFEDDSSDEASSLIGADYDDGDELGDDSDCSSAVAILQRHQQQQQQQQRQHQTPIPAIRTLGRRAAKARLMMGVRQTEELVASSVGRGQRHNNKATLFGGASSKSSAKQSDENLLLARYYYA